METTLRNQRVEQITAIIKRARPLVEAIGRKDDGLESQLRRSLTSIPLNIAEGFGVHGGNARLRFPECARVTAAFGGSPLARRPSTCVQSSS